MNTRSSALLFVMTMLASSRSLHADDDSANTASMADRRLVLMKERVMDIRIETGHAVIPRQLEPEPLFRYDDPTRGYVDGTIWRLGHTGRPFAIITAELHPQFFGRPSIVYDLLSFTNRDFDATSVDLQWRPRTWGADRGTLPDGPEPANSDVLRLVQMKAITDQFTATQDVEGELIQLRRLAQPIDRYQPEAGNERRDGATFLYVNGRNPAIVVLLETDGQAWNYCVGRLSLPSRLTLTFRGNLIWQCEALPAITDWDAAYTAANIPVKIPGAEAPPAP